MRPADDDRRAGEGRAAARDGGPDGAGRRPDVGRPGSDASRFRPGGLGCRSAGVRYRSEPCRSRPGRLGPRPGRSRLGAYPCERERRGRAGVRGVAHGARRDQSGARLTAAVGRGRVHSGWPRQPCVTRWPGCGISPPRPAIAPPRRATEPRTRATGRPTRGSAMPSRPVNWTRPSLVESAPDVGRVCPATVSGGAHRGGSVTAKPRRRTANGPRRTAATPTWTS